MKHAIFQTYVKSIFDVLNLSPMTLPLSIFYDIYFFSETLFGFLPELQWDNCCIAQTGSVVRFSAMQAKLNGTCPEDCGKADMIFETTKDIFDGKIG